MSSGLDITRKTNKEVQKNEFQEVEIENLLKELSITYKQTIQKFH
jgi:hypothetical protein